MDCFDIVSTVIEGISSFATVAAVIVALYANKKSNEQLLKALEMHEQSKNVELFGRRMECVRNLRARKIPSEVDIKILFDSNVQRAFDRFLKSQHDWKQHKTALNNYEYILHQEYPKAVLDSPMALLKKAEWDYQNGDTEEFESLCKKYERPVPPDLPYGNETVYNYKRIITRISASQNALNGKEDELINMMLDFIKHSIQPLTK